MASEAGAALSRRCANERRVTKITGFKVFIAGMNSVHVRHKRLIYAESEQLHH